MSKDQRTTARRIHAAWRATFSDRARRPLRFEDGHWWVTVGKASWLVDELGSSDGFAFSRVR